MHGVVRWVLTKYNIKKCYPINVDDAKKIQIIELSQKIYIDLNFDGLKDNIIQMLARKEVTPQEDYWKLLLYSSTGFDCSNRSTGKADNLYRQRFNRS